MDRVESRGQPIPIMSIIVATIGQEGDAVTTSEQRRKMVDAHGEAPGRPWWDDRAHEENSPTLDSASATAGAQRLPLSQRRLDLHDSRPAEPMAAILVGGGTNAMGRSGHPLGGMSRCERVTPSHRRARPSRCRHRSGERLKASLR
jgi:hypothetical protein